MPKNLTSLASSVLAQKLGTEPINIIGIKWNRDDPDGIEMLYADDDIPLDDDSGLFAEGRILELNNLEDVVNFDQNNFTTSVSIVLDDTDGVLKNIIDNNNIFKGLCTIYQYFEGFNPDDKILLFRGVINTPIVWSESARTLSFDVITDLEDKEVGFATEEGQFPYLSDDLIGEMWPLVFGQCYKVPATRVTTIPDGELLEQIGIPDPELYNKIVLNIETYNDLRELAFFYIIAAAFISLSELEGDNFDNVEFINPPVDRSQSYIRQRRTNYTPSKEISFNENPEQDEDDANARAREQLISQAKSLKEQLELKAADLLAQAAEVSEETIELKSEYSKQLDFDVDQFRIKNWEQFPQHKKIRIDIDSATFEGIFKGDKGVFHVEQRWHPSQDPDRTFQINPIQGFFKAEIGARIKIVSKFPITYIANTFESNIQVVYAWKTINNRQTLIKVPKRYFYNKESTVLPGTSGVTLKKPLSSYRGEEWDDDLFITQKSDIGPNTCDVLRYVVENYSNGLTVDDTTFDLVSEQIEAYPSHFALLERKNVIDFLQEVAFQARCALWIKNKIVYIKYLPKEVSSVTTFNEDDVSNIEITTTDSESIITKIIGEFVNNDYSQEDKAQVIGIRNAVHYGIHDLNVDYYIYTDRSLVEKSIIFWLIRKSEIWKRVSFKTFLHKFIIDIFDTVELDFASSYISNGPVKALIENMSFDSDQQELNLQCWVPVVIGELEPDIFAWPADISIEYKIPLVEKESKNINININAEASSAIQHNGERVEVKIVMDDEILERDPIYFQPDDFNDAYIINPLTGLREKVPLQELDTQVGNLYHWDRYNPTTPPPVNIDPIVTRSIITVGDDTVFYRGGDESASRVNTQEGDHQVSDIGDEPPEKEEPEDTNEIDFPSDDYTFNNHTYQPGELKPKEIASSFPGQITAVHDISNFLYKAIIYPQGLNVEGVEVIVKQLQQKAGQTPLFPVWTLISKVGNEYYMQLPVWIK